MGRRRFGANHDDPDAEMWMDISKGASIVILFVMSFACGLWPILSKSFKTSPKLLGIANAFSGGIFLCVGLLHLMPEAHEKFEGHDHPHGQSNHGDAGYPWAFLIALCSYGLILFVEKIAFGDSHEVMHNPEFLKPHAKLTNGEATKDAAEKTQAINDTSSLTQPLNSVAVSDAQDISPSDEEEAAFKNIVGAKQRVAAKASFQEKRAEQVAEEVAACEKAHHHEGETEHEHHEHADHHGHSHASKPSLVTPYLLLLALSFHGGFEGIAIGIQNHLPETLNLILAVVLHKWAEGLTLGLSFLKAGVHKQTAVIMLLIFSIIGPAGIGIGWVLTHASDVVTGTFMAISAGTFLYIAASEVIVEEFSVSKHRWAKFFWFVLGAAMLAGVKAVEGMGEHDHDH